MAVLTLQLTFGVFNSEEEVLCRRSTQRYGPYSSVETFVVSTTVLFSAFTTEEEV